MIRITNLSKEYRGGVKAVVDVNLEVHKGEFVALLGLSGAGKSTLLRCINGLVQPTTGEVTVANLNVNGRSRELRELRRRVAMIFQQFNLVKRLTVLDNVLCGRLSYCGIFFSCCRIFSDADRELAWHALARVGLQDKAFQRADQLSGGQQQRVGIARALVQQPEVLLADEPVASLDPKSSRRVMDILASINREDGLTLLVSMHDVDLALEYASRVVGLRDGRMVLDKPAHTVSKADLEWLYQQPDDSAEFDTMAEVAYA
ncbi:phosphonate ABC transporter ATP-binding protein [Desulfofundulus sp. TPOSR]|uniref:Phosphonate ABC transporter, ATPase subunit n=1 Tax=Desulfofundulus kuznetsovii (strain DSM 6115 / VKM B-1805 / 17) TaxID=760568 RepID=A0AAU8PE95_DESK7|nr:phosphonate ABC transporter ATP-binding protein [Desulfofundulus sp. TPOSR]AEG15801.1 phosphonate ABC transporter, ATPase subunit [Desulfofundulus kuznetsovii DSM 6115]NHM27580.1 phosphonate ABC transporter ATP-binding protein [Desulfofundulus sp. TPOSR]